MKIALLVFLCGFLCYGAAEEVVKGPTQVEDDDDSDMYMEPLEEDHQGSSSDIRVQAQAGHWLPTFSRTYDPFDHPAPSGHSRPVFHETYQQQEGAYSQRNDPPFQQDVNYQGYNPFNAKEYQQQTPQPQQQNVDKSASLLGDGNFGVIQGGTFYAEKEGYDGDSSGFDDFSSYFHNGHGRPSYFYPSNPKPAKQQQQFENFRDFADINSPPERQYSQYVVVYTNKNGTRTSTVNPSLAQKPEINRPKNILESLALLDSGTQNHGAMLRNVLELPQYEQGDVIEIAPEKKMSKSKRKLLKLKPEKKHEARLQKKETELSEPLLALS
ncbi:uncharacterized protein LOC126734361 [Anthonomus grandis grandis]|uniref:uncharacterized protein LOC126734361 n=1 Tax=Anthonomus grandis grandis TaxID=2921223 RepID=UPI002165C965|nr:uncharacterized protein LOC126734361 [Anthonomus grandis grandis]